jgi:hypothetical protein
MKPDYSIEWPVHFESDEPIIKAKGYFGGLKVLCADRVYCLTLYDPIRLSQEVRDALEGGEGLFCEENLIVVPEVGRREILAAVEVLAGSGFATLRATS